MTWTPNLVGLVGNDWVEGGFGADIIDDGEGVDILNGGGGIDAISGGMGADTIVFTGAFGVDRITDWENGIDLIYFSDHHVFDFFEDVMAVATQFGDNVKIEFNSSNKLIINDVDLADLEAGGFIF